tara:strand:+ start:761 stop:1201 length:441 start_codon:yes stop_codon:yes gene_type:complete
MAFIDTSITGSFKDDRDQNVFIGIDLPFYRSLGSEGYFASTTTTISAVKNNIKNLIQTEKGERLLQPDVGINLKNYLFEQITTDLYSKIEEDILSTLNFWLPFVTINKLDINIDNSTLDDKNTITINIVFSLTQTPSILESIQIEI